MKENGNNPRGRAPDEIKRRRRRQIMIAAAILVMIIIILLLLRSCKTQAPNEGGGAVLLPDIGGDVQDITTRQDLLSAMQEAADASYFTLKINPEASFSAATGEGSFEIINPPENAYPISVIIRLDDDKTVIYESGGIMPNQYISKALLPNKLSKGVYDATARVSIYDPETKEMQGETEAKIKITVS
jgi:hypothetical protein